MTKHPETAALAKRAYEASCCKTYGEFSEFLGGVGKRTVARWMLGECPLGALAAMVLFNVAAGWSPALPEDEENLTHEATRAARTTAFR